MKVYFYLLGRKGYHVLQEFIKEFCPSLVSFVCIAKDPKIKNDFSSQIKMVCDEHDISSYFRKELDPNLIQSRTESIAFAIGWKWMIHNTDNLIVVHDSLLPRYRGFSPLVNMLINGERDIGITALKANKSYDTGDIVCQKSLNIDYPIKIKVAIEKILPFYSEVVAETYRSISNNKDLNAIPQDHSEASYSLWRDELDYFITWSNSSEQIKRFIDAVGHPYLGAQTFSRDKRIVIHDASIMGDVNVESRQNHLGKIIFVENKKPIVVCGKGLLRIDKAYFAENDEPISSSTSFRTRFTSTPSTLW